MANSDFIIENGLLISYKGSEENIEIPADVDRIGAGAFENNIKLENINFLGKKLKSIDENAFRECTNLKGIKLPKSLVQIGDYAFLGCENMEYIYIPSSVVMIGKHIVESKVTVLGSTDSEAEKYAKSGHLAFKTNFEAFIHSLEQTHIAQNNVETKTFDIFGEKITVSNSLARYHDIIEYYTGAKEPLYETMLSYVYNMGDKSKKYDPNGALNELKMAAVKRLEKSGIFIAETRFLYVIEPMKAILEVYKAASTAYVELAKGVSEDIESKADMLYSQAESQVTGLSYGYIGDSFGLAVYGIDDFLTKQRQRKKAYAQANSQMNAFKEQHIAKGKEIYREFCDKIAPFLHTGVSAYVDAVCKTEIEYYISNKLIDAEIIDAYDVEKSAELVSGLYSKSSPNPEFVFALALKKYPINMAAHIYALEKEFTCDGLELLREFLGLNEKLEIHKDRVKKEKFNNVCKKVLDLPEARDAVKLINESTFLTKNEIKEILTQKAVTIGSSVRRLIEANIPADTSIADYCKEGFNKIIDKESWDFFNIYNVSPVVTNSIPAEALTSFDTLLNYIENTVTSLNGKNTQLLELVVKELESASTYEDYNKVILKLNKLHDFANSKDLLETAKNRQMTLGIMLLGDIESELNKASRFEQLEKLKQRLDELCGHPNYQRVLDVFTLKKKRINKATKIKKLKRVVIALVAIFISIIALLLFLEDRKIKQAQQVKQEAEQASINAIEMNYEHAVQLIDEGRKAEAAIAFGKAYDYQDAKEKSFKLWNEIAKRDVISAGEMITIALTTDGEVLDTGYHNEDYDQCRLHGFGEEIIAISTGYNYSVALLSNGTVFVDNDKEDYNLFRSVDEWTDIVAVSAGDSHIAGLKSDGTVLIAGKNTSHIQDAEEWSDIVAVSAGSGFVVGLKSDGAVVAAGYNGRGQCDVSEWRDVIAVSACSQRTIGLKSDGTVVATGENDYGQCNVGHWKDIVAISAGDNHTIGLKSDGTVVSTGNNEYGQCNVDEWTDIVAISAGEKHTVGLKSDGTVVATTYKEAGYSDDKYFSQCDVSDWNNIKIPNR